MRQQQRYNKPRFFEKPIGGIAVSVRDGNIEKAMRKLKRKVKDAGIMQEIKDRQFYTKKSEKKRLAKAAGRKRWLKKVAKMQDDF